MDYQKFLNVFNKYRRDEVMRMTKTEINKLEEDKETLRNYVTELIKSCEEYIINRVGPVNEYVRVYIGEYIEKFIDTKFKFIANFYYDPGAAWCIVHDYIQFLKGEFTKIEPEEERHIMADYVRFAYEQQSEPESETESEPESETQEVYRRDTIGPFDFITRFYEADPKNSILLRLEKYGPLFYVMNGESIRYQNIFSKKFEVEYIEDKKKFRIKFIEEPRFDINEYNLEEEQQQMKKL